MLGDGIVSFGVCASLATDCRYSKASAKIVCETPSLPSMCSDVSACQPAETATNRSGNSHLCLTVNDLRACHADLNAKGVRFKSEPVTITAGPNAGGLVVYFYDPDGYTLELFQPPQ